VPDEEPARLFVALELPPAARGALAEWRADVVGDGGGPRLLDPEDLHVTLCFLGWQPGSAAAAIAEAAALAVGEAGGRLELGLGPAIWLPPRRPRVLAVELVDPDGRLGALQALLAGALERGGWYHPEQRPFRPHVTVARVSRGARVPRGEPAAPPGLQFPGGAVTLFRSRLSRSGARYEPLARIA
jgi:2'-5' RNA ligase